MPNYLDDGVLFNFSNPKNREEYMEWKLNGQEEQYYYNKSLAEICRAYLEHYDAT